MSSGGLKSDQEIGNLLKQIEDMKERLTLLEKHALTSQDIIANKIAVGNIPLAAVGDGGLSLSGGLSAGDDTGYQSIAIRSGAVNEADLLFMEGGSIRAIWRKAPDGNIWWQRYDPAGTFKDTALIFDSSDGDIYTIPWTYYDPSPTIVGWASLTTKHIYYKKIGKLVHVWLAIQGTSNATNAYFYMPFNVKPADGQSFQVPMYVVDNGTAKTTLGRLDIPSAGNQFHLYKDMTAAAWTASSTKGMRCHFTYQAN